jgi:DNA adenine methylase
MNDVILKYAGSKWRLAEWIIKQIPPHKVYVELFFGSGSVFFTKTPSHIETINDINGDVVNYFKVIRNNSEELSRLINLTPWAREEYSNSYERNNNDTEVERARKFAINCWMSYGASQHKYNGFRTGVSPTAPQVTKIWNKVPKVILQSVIRLKDAQIENRPALDIIKKYNNPDTLIYLDPPYLHESRKFTKHYKYEMTDFDHKELLQLILKSKSKIILSGYDNELYNNQLKDWVKLTKQARCETGDKRTEVLWLNFDVSPMFKYFD